MEYILFTLYSVSVLGLMFYGMNCYYMMSLYKKNASNRAGVATDLDFLPNVTIQLPIYNEKYVVDRLIKSAAEIDYPWDKLDIQVLDDSTDSTKELAGELVRKLRETGLPITHIHRTDRKGFKAGALSEGLKVAKGEFVTIFDADFIPEKAFLRKTISHFKDPAVCLVQTRWGHVNYDYSMLTRAQSIGIDGHFIVEQGGRNRSGLFMNFNGTAGIWRKEAIFDAGGWQADTLTEDIDLSYRAQLRGWKMVYCQDVITPAEIPVDINAFKSQQYRWAKGSIQTAKKLLPRIFSSNFSFTHKVQALIHLTHYMIHPLMCSVALLTVPILLLHPSFYSKWFYAAWVLVLVASTCAPSSLYVFSQKDSYDDWKSRVCFIPFLMVIGTGIAISNSRAVFEAIFSIDSPFIRTPKLNITDKGQKVGKGKYRSPLKLLSILEVCMGFYCLYGLSLVISQHYYLISPFLLMYALGFYYVGTISIYHRYRLSTA